MKHVCILGLGLGLGLGLAMGSTGEASAVEPTIIQHARPRVPPVDVRPFIAAGCVREGSELDCSRAPQIQRFGCFGDRLVVDDALGGLLPRAAIAECNAVGRDGAATGIVRLGCRLPLQRRYLVSTRAGFELIDTRATFMDQFGPVTNSAEALGFAVALTMAEPKYEIELEENEEFLASFIETTHVRRTSNGFSVHLFDMEFCGCGQHPTSAVDYMVSRSGAVRELESEPAWQLTQTLCID
jgi:hypothetical protein